MASKKKSKNSKTTDGPARRLYERLVKLGFNLSDPAERQRIEQALIIFSKVGPLVMKRAAAELRKEPVEPQGNWPSSKELGEIADSLEQARRIQRG